MPLYAWVYTIFDKTAEQLNYYAYAAAVSAVTLRPLTKHKILLQVTTEIKQENLVWLKRIFDEVITVAEIKVNYVGKHGGKRLQHLYTSWIGYCLTKYRAMTLEQYDKICLLDADTYFTANSTPDVFFDYKIPSGLLGHENYKYEHNVEIPATILDQAIEQGYGIRGVIIVVKPSKSDFQLLIDNLPMYMTEMKIKNLFIGPDEYVISSFYRKWYAIPTKLISNSWNRDAANILSHFVSEKPWTATEMWPDFIYWFKILREAMAKYNIVNPPMVKHIRVSKFSHIPHEDVVNKLKMLKYPLPDKVFVTGKLDSSMNKKLWKETIAKYRASGHAIIE